METLSESKLLALTRAIWWGPIHFSLRSRSAVDMTASNVGAASERKDMKTIKLIGHAAICYVEQLGGSIGLSKYADPTDGGRDGIGIDEAREIARVDPSLIYFHANTAHPDHATIMELVNGGGLIPILEKMNQFAAAVGDIGKDQGLTEREFAMGLALTLGTAASAQTIMPPKEFVVLVTESAMSAVKAYKSRGAR